MVFLQKVKDKNTKAALEFELADNGFAAIPTKNIFSVILPESGCLNQPDITPQAQGLA